MLGVNHNQKLDLSNNENFKVQDVNALRHGLNYGDFREFHLEAQKDRVFLKWDKNRWEWITLIVTPILMLGGLAGTSYGSYKVAKVKGTPFWGIPVVVGGVAFTLTASYASMVAVKRIFGRLNAFFGKKENDKKNNELLKKIEMYKDEDLLREEDLLLCQKDQRGFYNLIKKCNVKQLNSQYESWGNSGIISSDYYKLFRQLNSSELNFNSIVSSIRKLQENKKKERLHPSDPAEFLVLFLRKLSELQLLTPKNKAKLIELFNSLSTTKIYTVEHLEFLVKNLLSYDCSLEEAISKIPAINLEKNFTLIVEGNKYSVSKELLSTYSSSFKSIFLEINEEKTFLELKLDRISLKAFEKFLECLHGEAFTPDPFDHELLILIERFQVEHLSLLENCLSSFSEAIQDKKMEELELYQKLRSEAPNIYEKYFRTKITRGLLCYKNDSYVSQ